MSISRPEKVCCLGQILLLKANFLFNRSLGQEKSSSGSTTKEKLNETPSTERMSKSIFSFNEKYKVQVGNQLRVLNCEL